MAAESLGGFRYGGRLFGEFRLRCGNNQWLAKALAASATAEALSFFATHSQIDCVIPAMFECSARKTHGHIAVVAGVRVTDAAAVENNGGVQ